MYSCIDSDSIVRNISRFQVSNIEIFININEFEDPLQRFRRLNKQLFTA